LAIFFQRATIIIIIIIIINTTSTKPPLQAEIFGVSLAVSGHNGPAFLHHRICCSYDTVFIDNYVIMLLLLMMYFAECTGYYIRILWTEIG